MTGTTVSSYGLYRKKPGPLSMSDVSRDNRTASAGKGYYIIYFGKEMMDSWLFNLPVKNSSLGNSPLASISKYRSLTPGV